MANKVFYIKRKGDKIVVRFRASGTQKGEFQGISPTERSINITGAAIYRITGCKFIEDWTFMDTLVVMRQLGLIPGQ